MNKKELFLERFEVVPVNNNLISIADCINAAKQIDFHIKEGNIFLVLYFDKNITVTASFIGFLVERIHKIQKLKGEIIIIAPNEDVRNMLHITGIDSLVSVVQ